MASRTVRVYTSDLSGKEVSNTDDLTEIRVLDHPSLNRPVKLDAYALEVQSLLDAGDQFVTLEVLLPGQAPRRLVVQDEVFAKVFQSDVANTLAAADPYYRGVPLPRPENRGPAAKVQPSSDAGAREQRAAIRRWANNNGDTIGDRGRIKTEIIGAFEAAHN